MRRQGVHEERTLIGAARELRRDRTPAESALWQLLRGRPRGLKFRRQHQIANFIVDFYCIERRLAIELDGAYHFEPAIIERDAARAMELQKLGVTLLRFENEDVLVNPGVVMRKIFETAAMLDALRHL